MERPRRHGLIPAHPARASGRVRRAVALAAAGALTVGTVVGVGASSAGATDRGANGKIAFSHAGGQIAVLNNGAETILTPSGHSQSRPAFSPDGGKIAYIEAGHLYTMKADGTGATAVRVANNPFEDEPTWSPDATQLAYIDEHDGQIYTVKVNGGTPKQITSTGVHVADLAWSPDGTKIAYDDFDSATSAHQLYTVKLSGKTVTRLTSQPGCDSVQPNWSPDGTQLAFSTACFAGKNYGGNIAIMPAVAGGSHTSVALFYAADAGYPAWAPDGSMIVFSANEGLGSEQLWESSPANTGGSGSTNSATQLTSDPGQPLNTVPSWQPVHHPQASAGPSTVAPGATTTVTGTDFLSEQVVKLLLIDANQKHFNLGSGHTALDGGFTHAVTIPAGAAIGKAKVKATGVGGLTATATVTVASGP